MESCENATKNRDFLDHLSKCRVLKKGSVSWSYVCYLRNLIEVINRSFFGMELKFLKL